MLYHVLPNLATQVGFLNVFKYLTFRTGGAILTSLLISFIFGDVFIRWLKRVFRPMVSRSEKMDQKGIC